MSRHCTDSRSGRRLHRLLEVAVGALTVALLVPASGGCDDGSVTVLLPAPRATTTESRSLDSRKATVLNPNGGWCWWQSQRALITSGGELLTSSVPAPRGADGRGRSVDVNTLDLVTGDTAVSPIGLGTVRSDDHNNAGFVELPSGRVVVGWAGHSEDTLKRYAWRDRDTATWTTGEPVDRAEAVELNADGSRATRVTYTNLLWVSQDAGGRGRLYDIFRGRRNEWTMLASDDEGETWSTLGPLWSTDGGRLRPYAHFVADEERIWFTVGDDHPSYGPFNALYSGFVQDGWMFRVDGTRVGRVGRALEPARFTLVHRPGEADPGMPGVIFDDSEAWGSSLTLTEAGIPIVTFSVRRPEPSTRPGRTVVHNYYWALLDRGRWDVRRLGHGGSDLYAEQPNYSGLVTVDPATPYRVYASTDHHPATGAPLVSSATGRMQHEIWEGRSSDGGRSWAWTPVTSDSRVDNIRPIAVAGPRGGWALVWARGTYPDFIAEYALELVAIARSDGAPARSDLGTVLHVAPAGTRTVVGDFDGDAVDDVFAYAPGGTTRQLSGRPGRHFALQPRSVSGRYLVAAGDVDGNGVDDVVWYDPASGHLHAWTYRRGGTYASREIGTSTPGGVPVAGDLDGDGRADLLIYAGRSTVLLFSGGAGWRSVAAPVRGTGYRPVVGDVDGNGVDDVLWHNPGRPSTTWLFAGDGTLTSVAYPQTPGTARAAVGERAGGDVLLISAGGIRTAHLLLPDGTWVTSGAVVRARKAESSLSDGLGGWWYLATNRGAVELFR